MSFKFLVQHSDNSFSRPAIPWAMLLREHPNDNATQETLQLCILFGVRTGEPMSGWPNDTYINVSSDNFSVRNTEDTV